jgi:HPt (histidine-containing phosphotransfer) domain-containing protein
MNASPALTSTPALDPDVLADLRAIDPGDGEGEEGIVSAAARALLVEAPQSLSALGAALAANDAEGVFQATHRLKGGALTLGALKMGAVCVEIEAAARAGLLDLVAAHWAGLTREYEHVRVALQNEIR